jgi:hypothetical protein
LGLDFQSVRSSSIIKADFSPLTSMKWWMWNKIRKIGSVNGKVKIEGLRLKRRQGEQTAISTRVLTTLVIASPLGAWRSTVPQ